MINRDGLSSRSYCNGRLAAYLQALDSFGIRSQQVLTGTGLTAKELSLCDSIISTAQVIKIYENTLKQSSDPQLAWFLGARANIASLGIYGFTILSAPTLRQALVFAGRYSKIITPTIKINYQETPLGGKLSILPAGAISYSPQLLRFMLDYHVSVFNCVLKELLGDTFTPSRIDFSYPASHFPEVHKNLITCHAHYHTPDTAYYLAEQWLHHHNPRGNSIVFNRMKEECDERMAKLATSLGISGRIRNYFLTTQDNRFSMGEVCEHLALSERTLRRKLNEEGTSFSEVIDSCRLQIAIKYLEETHLPIEGIASRLGFSSAVGFRQAFHRWTGATPSKIRNKN